MCPCYNMIQFACKTIQVKDVIKCSLGLTKAEVLLFEHFIKSDCFCTTQKLSEELQLDLSTVQRGVKKLYDQDVLERKQTNVSGGGYYFSYAAKSKSEIKKTLLTIINSWMGKVEDSLDSWMK